LNPLLESLVGGHITTPSALLPWWEGQKVRLQFMIDERLQNLDEGILRVDVLIAGRLINQSDDPNPGQPSDEDLRLVGDVHLILWQNAGLSRREERLADVGQQFCVVAHGLVRLGSWNGMG
jgi:hypothetical protein